MRDLTKFLIKAYVRKGLAILGTYLIVHGVFSNGSADDFASLYLDDVLGSLMIAGSALWTYFYQWYVKRKVVAAINAPPSVTPEKLEQAVKQMLPEVYKPLQWMGNGENK